MCLNGPGCPGVDMRVLVCSSQPCPSRPKYFYIFTYLNIKKSAALNFNFYFYIEQIYFFKDGQNGKTLDRVPNHAEVGGEWKDEFVWEVPAASVKTNAF